MRPKLRTNVAIKGTLVFLVLGDDRASGGGVDDGGAFAVGAAPLSVQRVRVDLAQAVMAERPLAVAVHDQVAERGRIAPFEIGVLDALTVEGSQEGLSVVRQQGPGVGGRRGPAAKLAARTRLRVLARARGIVRTCCTNSRWTALMAVVSR